jgi:uncharacterized protein YfiM (DUF2279 family)
VGLGYHLGRAGGGGSRASHRTAAVSVALSLGLIKELWDGRRPGNHFCTKDLAADIAGTACGALLFTRR